MVRISMDPAVQLLQKTYSLLTTAVVLTEVNGGLCPQGYISQCLEIFLVLTTGWEGEGTGLLLASNGDAAKHPIMHRPKTSTRLSLRYPEISYKNPSFSVCHDTVPNYFFSLQSHLILRHFFFHIFVPLHILFAFLGMTYFSTWGTFSVLPSSVSDNLLY